MNQVIKFESTDAARTAVILGDHRISYGRFSADVENLARWLVCQGVTPGQRIGIFLRNNYWCWVCHLAALRLGLILITLVPHFKMESETGGLLDVALGELEDVDAPVVIARQLIVFSPQDMAPFAVQVESYAAVGD